MGKALTGAGVVGAPGRGAGVVVKIRWANRPARSPAFSMGCKIVKYEYESSSRAFKLSKVVYGILQGVTQTFIIIIMPAYVLVIGVVRVDEGGLGLGIVIVLVLVLLGLSGLK